MAQSIILKRSATSGKVPTISSLNIGELAINTYDGKIFLNRSGSSQSIQEIVTTNVTNTGSITLTQTGSFGELIVSHDINAQRDLYVVGDVITNGSLDISGSITGSSLLIQNDGTISGNLTVLGAINATQFNVGIISSSILYQSGSTKFGDTIDDTHEFTGSIGVSGSIILNGIELGGSANSGSFTGSFTGSFAGDGSGLRGVVSDELPRNGFDYDINDIGTINDFNLTSSKYLIDFDIDALIGTPVGHKTYITNFDGSTKVIPAGDAVIFQLNDVEVARIDENGFSGSLVLPSGLVSGSPQLTSSYDARYVLSGSITQTTWDNIASKPSGIVSGSSQFTSSYDMRYVVSGSITQTTWDNIASKPSGIISGSSQLTSSFDSRYSLSGSSTSGLSRAIETYTATDNQTTFNTVGSASLNNVDVHINGYKLPPSDFTVVNSNTITLTTGSNEGELVEIGLYNGFFGTYLTSYDLVQLNSETASLENRANNLATISGSLIITASNNVVSISNINILTASVTNQLQTLATYTSSLETRMSAVATETASLETRMSSIAIYTSSLETRMSEIATETASLETRMSAVATETASLEIRANSLANLTGSLIITASNLTQRVEAIEAVSGTFARTDSSNTFVGNQIISGAVYITSDLVIYGSSSIQNISASNVYFGDNILTLNTVNPSVRFAGIEVVDSGSQSGVTGSLLWDSTNNRWLYAQPSGSGAPYNSAILINGPENSGSLGSETTLTANYIPVAQAGDHIMNSKIWTDGVNTGIGSNLQITGSIYASGTTIISGSSQISFTGIIDKPTLVSGSSQVDVMSTTNIARLATTGSNSFNGSQTITGSIGINTSYDSLYGVSIKRTGGSSGALRLIGNDNIVGVPGIHLYNDNNSSGSYIGMNAGGGLNLNSAVNISPITGNTSIIGNLIVGSSNSSGSALSITRVAGQATIKGSTANGGDGQVVIDGASNSSNVYLNNYVSANVYLCTGGGTTHSGLLIPHSNNTYDLGSSANRWANLYTNDLHLSNEGKMGGNEVDGTTGNWTIQEGEEHLYILNNKTGKKFKFSLEEIQ